MEEEHGDHLLTLQKMTCMIHELMIKRATKPLKIVRTVRAVTSAEKEGPDVRMGTQPGVVAELPVEFGKGSGIGQFKDMPQLEGGDETRRLCLHQTRSDGRQPTILGMMPTGTPQLLAVGVQRLQARTYPPEVQGKV